MSRPENSADSLANASKSTDTYSAHGNAQGAAGVIDDNAFASQDALDKNGESGLIMPPEGGFQSIHIGLSWNNFIMEKAGGLMGLIKKATRQGVDLDLGCFFELADGTRGILQPFGNLFGNLNTIPYIQLSGDERTGDSEGDDEFLTVNGQNWLQIKRILVYAYIYKGSKDWSQIKPTVTINMHNGDTPIKITPQLKTSQMTVCALATLSNVKGAIKINAHGEYFTSQASMDRAFGFGLEWQDGSKD